MKNKVLMFLKSICLFLFTVFFPIFFFELIGVDPNKITQNDYIGYNLLINILIFVIILIIYHKELYKEFILFKSNLSDNLKLSFKYWTVGFLIMIMSNIFIIYFLHKGIAGNEMEVRKLINLFPLYMIFNTIIYAPFVEETIFRRSIRDYIDNKYIYILTSGLIFGFLHVFGFINSPSDLLYMIPYSSLGIVFATLYYKTNNLFSTITIHSFHNFLALLLVFMGDLL